MRTPAKIKMFYDPLGNVIRTVNPDNTEQWVIHGKPHALSSVEVKNHWSFSGYDPTPWESYTYDANDLATKTGHTATGHEFTPASAYIDPLGRPVKSIARLGTAPTDEVITRQRYDIQGNVLYVEDALNRIVFRHKYGIGKQLLWKEHIDSGVSTLVADATGKPITAIDAREAQVLTAYDALSRPVKVWAKEQQSDPYTLRQVSKYAENELGIAAAKEKNIVGQLYQHFDEAGLNQIERCDYKGNPLEKVKQVISDATLLATGTTSYTVDWTNSPSILDSTEYRTTIAYDALNRATQMIYPKDVENKRKVVIPKYNNAGALEGISMRDDIGGTETSYAKHIAYNAKGQRILVAYNNTVMTRYSYDSKTFHLKRQRSETYTKTGGTYTSGGNVKQDTAYSYDLVGNIIGTKDNVTGCGIGGVNHLDKEYVFDALYRLLSATGRENSPTATPFWDDSFRSEDSSITTAYTQNYSYDRVGNIQSLQHIGANNFTRNFAYNSASNQLQSIAAGQTNFAYTYDANGNQLSETTSRMMSWDYANRMQNFRIEASGSISQFSHYLYDAAGNRVKKITIKQSGDYSSTTYIDGTLEYTTDGSDEQNILHLMDGEKQIVEFRIGADFGDSTPVIKYLITDYLSSVGLQLKDDGATISREEFYPYGETSFGSYSKKRYRFCGKERDDESGYHYYGARYYATWMCRFISVDPLAGKSPSQTSYHYCSNNPVNRIDPSGETDGKAESKGGGNGGTKVGTNGTSEKTIVFAPIKNPIEGNITLPCDNTGLAPKVSNLGVKPAVTIDVYQGKDSEGETVEFNSSTTYSEDFNTNGTLTILHDINNDNKEIGRFYQKDAEAIGKKTDNRTISEKIGDVAGKIVESTIKPPVDKLDNYIKSASQVGANIEAKADFNKYSVGGKLGLYSTSETNGGVEASANYTIKANIKKTKEEGWSSTLSNFKFKPSVKINFYISHGEANKNRTLWGVSNSTIVEGKAFAGPLEISTDSKKVDQFSIGLLKSKQDFGAEFGVKNQTKWFGYSGTFQIGH